MDIIESYRKYATYKKPESYTKITYVDREISTYPKWLIILATIIPFGFCVLFMLAIFSYNSDSIKHYYIEESEAATSYTESKKVNLRLLYYHYNVLSINVDDSERLQFHKLAMRLLRYGTFNLIIWICLVCAL